MLRVARRLQRTLALGLFAFAFPLAAQAQVTVSMETGQLLANDGLRPGQSRWLPAAASGEGPISIVVSIPLQRAYVFRGTALIGISTVSSGQPGYDTPVGRFTILQKRVDHRSNLYDDAPMPFMQRLTWDGIALHAGQIPAEPASHGCIRLPRAFAQRLYGMTALGTVVIVSDQAPDAPEEALAFVTESTTLASN
ncbi:MAG TPA: L,D-transpeptidase family protein [Allosphingosinicella sp.]|nr:L,D-transpeptidase family protein [Allosphingosinicella sp.]